MHIVEKIIKFFIRNRNVSNNIENSLITNKLSLQINFNCNNYNAFTKEEINYVIKENVKNIQQKICEIESKTESINKIKEHKVTSKTIIILNGEVIEEYDF